MRVLAITGGIACGKSTVTALYRSLGARVIDADGVSRALTAPNGEALPAIRAAFGDGVFRTDGTLDRKALAARVFGDDTDEARQTLDRLMHPLIERRMRAELEQARQDGVSIAILDVPLLYESGMDKLADAVLCVTVPQAEQIRRLKERDGLTADEASARIHSQMPLAEKAARADFVLSTDAPPEETSRKALKLWRRLND